MKRELICLVLLGGCGTAFGEGIETSPMVAGSDAATKDSAAQDDGGIGCIPQTCDDKGWACGSGDNGCGVTLECRPCDAPSQCTSGHSCKCEPATCASLGVECGTFPTGCGGADLNCGSSCPTGKSCNKGKCESTPCTRATCNAGQCGTVSDGCGGVMQCTSCTAPQSCGGGGIANYCGCTKKTREDACGARQCGIVSDGCGGSMSCGDCPSGKSCDSNSFTCVATTCTATDSCATYSYGCGMFADSCGSKQQCGESPVYTSNATTTLSLCGSATVAGTPASGGYKYAHICDCVEKGTCKGAPYAGTPDKWHCTQAKAGTTTLNGRFCCMETH